MEIPDEKEFAQLYEEMASKLSAIDSKVVDLTHVVEYVDLNAAQMMKTYKLLKDSLQQRREIKEQMAFYHSYRDNMLPAIKKIRAAKETSVKRIDRHFSESLHSSIKYGIKGGN
jgi:hypothetical protein